MMFISVRIKLKIETFEMASHSTQLNETDLIASIMRNQNYLDQIKEEIHPDDTMDLLQGSRRGKNEIKDRAHI